MTEVSVPIEVIIASAKKGDTESAYRLGLLYEKGEYVDCDPKAAARWYQKAADNGHAWAQVAIGHLHAIGFGIPRSQTKAREWFSKATSQTKDMDVVAQVAELYYHGYGEGYDWFWADGAEAARLARIAAAKGNAEGQYRLAEMTIQGWHMSKNKRRARELYTKASNQGHEMAYQMLQHYFGEDAEQDEWD